MSAIKNYLNKINKRFQSGISTEHSYRPNLQELLEQMLPGITVTNEPSRIECGAPDYILTKNGLPIGYIEAKDIGKSLNSKDYKEQFTRYQKSLSNLIITDYIEFRLFRNGEFVNKVNLADIVNERIVAKQDNEIEFEKLIGAFATFTGITIKGAQSLSKLMAAKARMMADIIENAIAMDEARRKNGFFDMPDNGLTDQYNAFKDVLIHDITPKEFSDIYAQTIAYGMFAARLNDKTPDDFSRQEAAELIPKSNPFLRRLFQYIAGYDLDDRLRWIVDALAEVFAAADVGALLKDFGKSTQQTDPIIHFYETFLAEYDPKLRKSRGVWYTPEPVVNFIVRAVDDILKTEFDLPQGLADSSKVNVKTPVVTGDKRHVYQGRKGVTEGRFETHKVQILDPAAGTGTFLAEVVKQIHKKFEGQEGIWSDYVENHLIPRLHGFEILMASYAMAHLKLEMLLEETGFKPTRNQRLRVYLTNSLEEHHPDTGTLFASWLSSEANEANHIKRDTPVMVVLGNPPYSGESQNKGKWIMDLMEDYKKEPGGKIKLQERNPKWINDDYVKFIRYSQYFIEKNQEGILAFINPHGFLDNPTFRGMRWNLLKTYDKIYTIDLHGNSKKKEVCPDGSSDENVFDIQQGVSINLFVKTGKKKPDELGEFYHFDMYGKREEKYRFLYSNNIASVPYNVLQNIAPNYFMVEKNFNLEADYNNGFRINDLFRVFNVGIVTSRDNFVIDDNKQTLTDRIKDFFAFDKEALKNKYQLRENKSWHIDDVKRNAKSFDETFIEKISYRPFDDKYVYYDNHFIERSRNETMQHFLNGGNLGLVIGRQGQVVGSMAWNLVFLTNSIADFNLYYRGGGMIFPLYLHPEKEDQQTIEEIPERKPNLNEEIVEQIATKINHAFIADENIVADLAAGCDGTFYPLDLLDYIYAILHHPAYREKYKEFLKIDFPRIPYPKDAGTFFNLAKFGTKLRQTHLMESKELDRFSTTFPVSGTNEVEKVFFDEGKVWINKGQYFDQVPEVSWQFYIGGYQPAQKWLKDRKSHSLSYDDIVHYQKIITALQITDKLMEQLALIVFE